MRFFILFKTELLSSKSTIVFHFIAVIAPLMFLGVFAGRLSNDISFPVYVETESGFTEFIQNYSSPNDVSYYLINRSEEFAKMGVSIEEIVHLNVSENTLTGIVKQTIHPIDKNITKNYRNRLTGAVSAYFSQVFPEKAINIIEKPVYEKDPAWADFFTSSILTFCILICGFLFGAFSFTNEWESKSIEFLKLSPQNPLWLLGGKFFGALVKTIIAVFVYISFSALIIGKFIFIAFSIIPVILTASFFSICIGMIIGLCFKETLVAFISALIGSIILWVFGGGFGTNAGMPEWIQQISSINPASNIITLTQSSCLNGPHNPIAYLYPLICGIVLSVLLVFLYYSKIYKPNTRKVKL